VIGGVTVPVEQVAVTEPVPGFVDGLSQFQDAVPLSLSDIF
jgi:hypothetical protein